MSGASSLVLARAQLRRSLVRVLLVVTAIAAGWLAASPGTAGGLVGAYGGWLGSSARLLDLGLVPLAVVGALAGAGPRDQHLADFLWTGGTEQPRLVAWAVGSGAVLGLVVAASWWSGGIVGGWVRALATGRSWWAEPGASAGVGLDGLAALRIALAAAVVGALAALVGWLVRRDGRAVVVAVLLAVAYLPELSALLGRLPVLVDDLAFSPLGAVRAAALGDRGLPAPGYAQVSSPLPFAVVLAAWALVLVVASRPRTGRSFRRSIRCGPSGGRRALVTGRRGAAAMAAVGLTVAFGAVVPGAAASALPWRWQPTWRASEQAGWSSPQTVDRFVAATRADPAGDLSGLIAPGTTVDPAVRSSLARASSTDRQPVSAMAGPDHVVVRLDFATPVESGSLAFTAYLVRFELRAEGDRWLVVGAEGPVADVGHRVGTGS